MTQPLRARAIAHANIALSKYWGKLDVSRNLPAVPSLSVTLEGLSTETEVVFDEGFASDMLMMNNTVQSDRELSRVTAMLDRVRQHSGTNARAHVTTTNNFPTASGLASSASGFAALAVATNAALGLHLSHEQLSDIARQSSVSAARSLFGGYVELGAGSLDQASLAAREIAPRSHFPLNAVVLVVTAERKSVSSTDGMVRTAETSPYYKEWVRDAHNVFAEIRKAVMARDFEKLADYAELSALRMHAVAMAASPPVLYWNAATLALISEVKRLRKNGEPVFFTIDGGPQVKVFTLPERASAIEEMFLEHPDVTEVIASGIGHSARTLRVDS